MWPECGLSCWENSLTPGLHSPDIQNYNMPFPWMHEPHGALPAPVIFARLPAVQGSVDTERTDLGRNLLKAVEAPPCRRDGGVALQGSRAGGLPREAVPTNKQRRAKSDKQARHSSLVTALRGKSPSWEA